MAVDVDIWSRVGEISVPTLIMVGAGSKLATAERMEAMQQTLPRAKLVKFEGYGHGINLLAPQRCASEMRRFLDERDLPSGNGMR